MTNLKNNAALGQLPFNGKKTVPAALRKDLWAPFALISFPRGEEAVGLSAFQKLREYRRLHELLWDESLRTDKDGKIISRIELGRKLCDQKANSVADIATVLNKIGTPEGKEIGLKAFSSEAAEGSETVPQVEVKWSELVDAQFAESWSDNVIHDKLSWEKHVKEMKARNSELRRATSRENKRLHRELKAESNRENNKDKEQKHAAYLVKKAEKHQRYLEARGITQEQYEVELQALLQAKAERIAARLVKDVATEDEKKAVRTERKKISVRNKRAWASAKTASSVEKSAP